MDSKSNEKLSTEKSGSKKTNHRQRQDSLNSRRTSTDSESENGRRQSTTAEVENNDQQSIAAVSENKKNRRARFSIPDESAIASTSSPPPPPPTETIAYHKEPRKSILKNSNTISPDYISPPPAPDHDDEDVPIDNRFARHVDSMIVTNLRRAKDKDKKDHSKE